MCCVHPLELPQYEWEPTSYDFIEFLLKLNQNNFIVWSYVKGREVHLADISQKM